MKVSEIMHGEVLTVRPDSTIDEALDVLCTHRLTTLPVVQDGAVVAMVGEADVIHALVARDPRAHATPVNPSSSPRPRQVSEVMSGPAFTVHPSDDVHDVAAILAAHGWKSAAVVDAGRLVGVVSRSDVIATLNRSDDDMARELRELLAEVLACPCDVTVRHGSVHIRAVATALQGSVARSAALAVAGVREVHVDPPPRSGS
jgi:CBS domain-containing protein